MVSMSQRTGRVAVAHSVRLAWRVFSFHTSQWTPLIVALPVQMRKRANFGWVTSLTPTTQEIKARRPSSLACIGGDAGVDPGKKVREVVLRLPLAVAIVINVFHGLIMME